MKKSRFQYTPSMDSAFGALFNGSWNGLVGMLSRGVISLLKYKCSSSPDYRNILFLKIGGIHLHSCGLTYELYKNRKLISLQRVSRLLTPVVQ